jgi:hypothetical protein
MSSGAVLLDVMLRGFAAVMRSVHRMAMRQMRVMGRLLMRAILMVLGGFAMMLRGMLVMLGGGMVVLGTLMLGHAALLLLRGCPRGQACRHEMKAG